MLMLAYSLWIWWDLTSALRYDEDVKWLTADSSADVIAATLASTLSTKLLLSSHNSILWLSCPKGKRTAAEHPLPFSLSDVAPSVKHITDWPRFFSTNNWTLSVTDFHPLWRRFHRLCQVAILHREQYVNSGMRHQSACRGRTTSHCCYCHCYC